VSAPRETDRGTWRLVARRDFWVRLRDKGFVISTSVTLVLITVFVLVATFGGPDRPTFDVGLLGQASADLGPTVEDAASSQGAEVRTRTVHDRAAAERGLEDGSLACSCGRRRPISSGRSCRRRSSPTGSAGRWRTPG
jgi:hypothetical protein